MIFLYFTLGYLISVSVVWAILSVSDAKISTCTVSVSVWKKTIINVSVETKTVQSVIHSYKLTSCLHLLVAVLGSANEAQLSGFLLLGRPSVPV